MARRDTLLRIAAGLVGVVGVAMAAATVESPLETTGGGSGSGGTGGGDGAGQPVDAPGFGAPPELGSPPPFARVFATLVLVSLLLALAWYIYHDHRRVARMLAVTAVVLAVIFLVIPPLLDMLPLSQPEPPNQSSPGSIDNLSSGDDGGGGSDGDASIPMNLVVALLGVGVLLVVGARAVIRRRWYEPAVTNDDVPGEAATTAVGSAAGRAADRIEEDADVGNEIYRAWLEMTRLLDVDRPETSTPGEFASAAVETGMDRDHVDELTGLFESVRYGRTPATSDREDRAVGILRRIEDAYADADSPSADDDSTGSGGNDEPSEFGGDSELSESVGDDEPTDSDENDESSGDRW